MDDRRGKCGLGQQKDVMDAVQCMSAKAQGTGNLKTGSEQKVETKTTQSGQQVIVVEQASPEAVYLIPIPDTSRSQH